MGRPHRAVWASVPEAVFGLLDLSPPPPVLVCAALGARTLRWVCQQVLGCEACGGAGRVSRDFSTRPPASSSDYLTIVNVSVNACGDAASVETRTWTK